MRKLQYAIEIEFESYGRNWIGFVARDSAFKNAESRTDEEWNLLPKYKNNVWVTKIDGYSPNNPTVIDAGSIYLEAFPADALYSGWGCVQPAAGDGLEDCGAPTCYFVDADGSRRYLVRY